MNDLNRIEDENSKTFEFYMRWVDKNMNININNNSSRLINECKGVFNNRLWII